MIIFKNRFCYCYYCKYIYKSTSLPTTKLRNFIDHFSSFSAKFKDTCFELLYIILRYRLKSFIKISMDITPSRYS